MICTCVSFSSQCYLTNYPDRLLCVFYNTSLNERSKARLPRDGPRGSFAQYVEWVLLNCGSHFSICEAEEEDPVRPTHAMDPTLEPTTAMKPESATTSIPEPEPTTMSVPESEPATRTFPELAYAAKSIPERTID